jgi:hypothetical protein
MDNINPSAETDRSYTIRGSSYDFFTGVTTDGLQMLVVIACPYFISFLFDREGNLIESQEKLLSEKTRSTFARYGSYEALARAIDEELSSWFHALGFQEKPITVKQFFHPGHHIGIKEFPEYYSAILRNPTAYSPDENQLAQAEFKRWSSAGLFELWLNEGVNLCIDRSGQVESL